MPQHTIFLNVPEAALVEMIEALSHWREVLEIGDLTEPEYEQKCEYIRQIAHQIAPAIPGTNVFGYFPARFTQTEPFVVQGEKIPPAYTLSDEVAMDYEECKLCGAGIYEGYQVIITTFPDGSGEHYCSETCVTNDLGN